MLSYASVHPHLTYGILIWGSVYKSYLSTLQVLQNMRAITKQRSSNRNIPICRRLQISKINDLYKQQNLRISFRTNHSLHHLKNISLA